VNLLGFISPTKRQGLIAGSYSKHESEVNFKHGGHKRHETVTPGDVRVSLWNGLFDNAESCSTELVNLDEIIFLCFIIS